MRKLNGLTHFHPIMALAKTKYFLASSMVLIPPLALKPTLRRPEAIVSKMMLAASGVAETSVFPVEVFTKLAPLAMQIFVASAMSADFSITPVSRMIFKGCFLPVSLLA